MKKNLICLFLLLLLASTALAQEQSKTLDLGQVIRLALGTNEQIAAAEENLAYSQLLRRAAWSALIPNATLEGGLVRNDSEIEFSLGDEGSDGGNFVIQQLYDYSMNLKIGSPLYLGGRLYKTVEQSGINIGVNKDLLTKAQLDLMFQVSAAYAEVVKAQRQLEIIRTNLELAKRQLRQAEILFKAGEGIRTSVIRAEAQVASAEGSLIFSENALAKAREDLKQLVPLPKDFQVIEFQAPSIPSTDVEQLVKRALETRVEFRTINKQLAINKLDIEKAFGEKFPTVEWDYTYSQQRSGFPSNAFWRLSLNVSLSIYDSGASTIKKAQFESNRRKINLDRQLLERNVRAEIIKAYLDYETILKSKAAVAKELEAVRRAFADIERFYKAGEATDLDVQDIRQQLISTEIRMANLETDEKLSLFNIRNYVGLPVIEIEEGIVQ